MLRVELQFPFLRKKCMKWEILCSLEVRVSPGTIRNLSAWNHFVVLGSAAFEISALGYPASSSNVALPDGKSVSGMVERSHVSARNLDIYIMYLEGWPGQIENQTLNNWPPGFSSFTRHKEEIMQRWNSPAGSDSCPSFFLIPL